MASMKAESELGVDALISESSKDIDESSGKLVSKAQKVQQAAAQPSLDS